MSKEQAFKNIANFTKNVTGTTYRAAVKNEKKLGAQAQKAKKADAALLKELLHTNDAEKKNNLQHRMDIVESAMQKHDKAHSTAIQAADTAKADMTKAQKQLAIGGASLAGLIGAGMLAKKLHDKKKEKQEEKTAFQELDEMVKEAFTYHPNHGFHLNRMDEVRAYESLVPQMKSLSDFSNLETMSKKQHRRAIKSMTMHNVGVLKKHGFKGKRLTTKQWATQPLSVIG